ncbi:diaminopimelate decarboxylase [Streptomyces sp. DvalAA-14]|uniref:alanine racemase n=1 Tax=unclassified Streptomyces TaxID=2593676 RepID=UPI00081B8259|nr:MULTISPECIES: alanine racemase [unclassified Streptomyces]MYS24050.1 type III PLP-dependent enzyme [Streptomyces sp. SID4948]SCE42020.1 diaminopimelate decarboxylase [Streptomyces sp. DvalAA-14]
MSETTARPARPLEAAPEKSPEKFPGTTSGVSPEPLPAASAQAAPAVAAALRAGVETPAYVYDLAEIRANVARLRAALPEPSDLYYSLKANPHPEVLGTLRRAGTLPEVCSPGELAAALAAGWAAGQILYTGPGKRDQDVAAALAAGVRAFCVDSPVGLDQLDRLAAAAGAQVDTLLRVNDDRPSPGNGLAMTGVASQFGADTGWVLDEPARFGDRERVRVVGLHLYMGTNLPGVGELLDQFGQSLATAGRLAAALAPHTAGMSVLDLGGGFGAPFAHGGEAGDLGGLRAGLAGLLDRAAAGWPARRPRIAFESGRYLVGTAGTLLTRVLDAKTSHGRDVVVLESGINHLGGMSGLRRLPPLNPTLLGAAGHARDTDGRGETRPTLVTGPLCTPLDTWSRSAPLPPLRPGDLLAVPNVGAYGLSASLLAFLGHPAPLEVAVDGDQPPRVSRLELSRPDPAPPAPAGSDRSPAGRGGAAPTPLHPNPED